MHGRPELGAGGSWQWICIKPLLLDCSLPILGMIKTDSTIKCMWINDAKVHFSKILSTWTVAVSDYKDIHQLVYPRRQKTNKTKMVLNLSPTLYFMKETRTCALLYGKWDAFSRFFRCWQDEEATEIRKKNKNAKVSQWLPSFSHLLGEAIYCF